MQPRLLKIILETIYVGVIFLARIGPEHFTGAWRNYLHLRIRLVLIWMFRLLRVLDVNGYIWVEFFCFLCGRLGHTDKKCSSLQYERGKYEYVDKVTTSRQYQYGQ